VARAEAYLHAKFHLDPSNRLDTIHQRHRQTDKPVAFYGPIAPQFRMSPVRNAPELRSLHAATPPVQSEYPAEHRAAAAVPLPESPLGQTSKSISFVSFVRIESNFLQYTGHTVAKNDGSEF